MSNKYYKQELDDCKQRLRDFWYSDFMQEINEKPSLEDIERMKQEMIRKRQENFEKKCESLKNEGTK